MTFSKLRHLTTMYCIAFLFTLALLQMPAYGQQSTNDEFSLALALEDIGHYSEDIISHVPDFHKYEYDDYIGTPSTIANGRFDMYTAGNEVAFWTRLEERPTVILYGDVYENVGFSLLSVMTYPFTVLMWINQAPPSGRIYLQTRSFTSQQSGANDETFRGMVQRESYFIEYIVYQLYGSSENRPSICEVYYIIYNTQDRDVVRPRSFSLSADGAPPHSIRSTITLQGQYRRILLGYSLYSKVTSLQISKQEVELALNETLRIIIQSNSPDRPTPPTPVPPFRPQRELMVEKLVKRIEGVSNRIIQRIPDWYSYKYDSEESEIVDGGNDVFDYGNKVRYKKNEELYNRGVYDEVRFHNDFEFFARAIHPFVALLWIENSNRTSLSFTLQVDGNVGADQDGGIALYNGNAIEIGKFSVSYKVFQIHSAFDPSVCEVYFTVHSNQVWNSMAADAFEVVKFSQETDELINVVRVSGSPHRMLLGYMLLSKIDGILITENEVFTALSTMVFSFGNQNSILPQPGTVARRTTSPIPSSTPETTTEAFSFGSLLETVDFNQSPGDSIVEEVLSVYTSLSSKITNDVINDWNSYAYDDVTPPIDSIANGGSQMYDVGNQVSFRKDNESFTQANYNLLYRYVDYEFLTTTITTYDFLTTTSYPFAALMWIENIDTDFHTYTLRVNSTYGARGRGEIIRYNGTVRGKTYRIQYNVFHIHGTGEIPSVCEVYFTIGSSRQWRSSNNYRFEVESFVTSTGLSSAGNTVKISGYPRNTLLGYMLLSRQRGRQIVERKIRIIFRSFLISLSERSFDIPFPPTGQVVRTTTSTTMRQTSRPNVQPDTSTTQTSSTPSSSTENTDTGDLVFLPSCTVKEAVQRVLQCTDIFAEPVKYFGPQSCMHHIDSTNEVIKLELHFLAHDNARYVKMTMSLQHHCQQSTRFIIDLTSADVITMIKRVGTSTKKVLDCATSCVANQIKKCNEQSKEMPAETSLTGRNRNKLDSLNLPNFNSEFFIGAIRNLSSTSARGNDPITTFCHSAPIGSDFPHRYLADVPACHDDNLWDVLIQQANSAYYSFVWARHEEDVCQSLANLRTNILEVLEFFCSFESLTDVSVSEEDREYLVAMSAIAMQEFRRFRFKSCTKLSSSDANSLSYVDYVRRPLPYCACSQSQADDADIPDLCLPRTSDP